MSRSIELLSSRLRKQELGQETQFWRVVALLYRDLDLFKLSLY
jgi:hypothetical protein